MGKENQEGQTNKKGMIIRVDDSVMFGGGAAKLKPAGFPVLDDMAKLLQEFPCDILVEGHTDDTYFTRKFDSNWELSAFRAIAVMRYLVELGESIHVVQRVLVRCVQLCPTIPVKTG